MALPGQIAITLVMNGKEIASVEAAGEGVYVTPLTPTERSQFESGSYGLKPVDTLYETQIAQSAAKCYMIIGGYKVQVPCS